jgi:thioredoxin reductase (NADPH)
MYDVLIIGSGPAGLTAAIYTARANLKPLILAGTKWGGQLMLTTEVENFPGFPEGIQGPDLMAKMREQAERFGTVIKEEQVVSVDFSKQPFTVKTEGNEYQGKSVIVATGADTLWLGVKGEEKFIGRGVSSCAPCDAFFYKGREVIVVGGGDSAMEEALVVAKFATNVFIVHRRNEFRASKIMQDRVMKTPNIHEIFNTKIEEILGKQLVEKVRLQTVPSDPTLISKPINEIQKILPTLTKGTILSKDTTAITWEMPINGIFVAIGHSPNSKILQGILKLDAKGYLELTPTKDKSGLAEFKSASNIPGVFISGDIHDHTYRQAITAAAFGCMAALDTERWLEERDE